MVTSIYKGAYSTIFYLGGDGSQKYTIREKSNVFRHTPIGWGRSVKAAWKDAVDNINESMLEKLQK